MVFDCGYIHPDGKEWVAYEEYRRAKEGGDERSADDRQGHDRRSVDAVHADERGEQNADAERNLRQQNGVDGIGEDEIDRSGPCQHG